MSSISKKIITTSLIFIVYVMPSNAQEAVPVREEPRHKPVFENTYVRVLDVWLPAGDTTLYHIHSTPSLFNFLSKAKLSTQIRTGPWEISEPAAGFTWYKSFANDTLIHRIINIDNVPCHVMDVELLHKYDEKQEKPAIAKLPFDLLYENERADAYRLTHAGYINYNFSGRRPMVAELVSGDGIVYHNKTLKQKLAFKPGMYLYIEPGHSFYFTNKQKAPINMVLFELK